MKRLRVFESISIDGYFTGADGDMSWAHGRNDDAEFAEWVGSNASGGGDLLFGRISLEKPGSSTSINSSLSPLPSEQAEPCSPTALR